MADGPLVAIIVNYRTPAQTIACVRALASGTVAPDEIVVVDNGSKDGSVDRLAELEGVTVLASRENRGFSGGCNLGIRHAVSRDAARIFLVNSDAVIAPDCLARLVAALDGDPTVGIVGPAVLTPGARPAVESTGIFYSPVTGRMINRSHGLAQGAIAGVVLPPPDAVSGCAMLVRRDVFDDVGLFDEAYFFYFEDVDLCLRARAAGYGVACVTAASVAHVGAGTIGVASPHRIYFAVRNHLRLARIAAPRATTSHAALRACAIVGFNLAHVLVTAPVPRARGLYALVRGVVDHVLGRYGEGSPARAA